MKNARLFMEQPVKVTVTKKPAPYFLNTDVKPIPRQPHFGDFILAEELKKHEITGGLPI